MMKLLSTAALAVAATTPTQAAIVFSDSFDAETPRLVYENGPDQLANWTTTGSIDVVPSDTGIIVSPPAANNFIDLDGAPGLGFPGSASITTKNSYAFGAGDRVTLSFVVGGSQRVQDTDQLVTKIIFSDNFAFSNVAFSGGLTYFALDGQNRFANLSNISSNDPYSLWSFSFTSESANSIAFSFGTTSLDNYGPLLDNVTLDVTPGAVPEPATWAMIIGGFGILGTALRRNRRQAFATA